MENRFKVRLNSNEKIEELLQEIYDQSCKQIIEIQNEISKLIASTNLGEDGFSMDDKAKYGKMMHDFFTDKAKAISAKFEIAKFLGEVAKYRGDTKAAMNDTDFKKSTKLDIKGLRNAVYGTDTSNGEGQTKTYQLK